MNTTNISACRPISSLDHDIDYLMKPSNMGIIESPNLEDLTVTPVPAIFGG